MSRDLVHAVDWFPTLLSLAGDSKAKKGARGVEGDGVDMAGMVTRAEPGPRTELVYNINDALRCEAGLVGWVWPYLVTGDTLSTLCY